MIRSDKIKIALFGGVGFRNPTNPEYKGISEANQASSSGLYFQDASNFVSIQNIRDCQGDVEISSTQFNDYLAVLQRNVIEEVCRDIIDGQNHMLYFENLYPFEKAFTETLSLNGDFVGFQIAKCFSKTIISKIEWVEISFDKSVTFNLYLFNSNLKQPIGTLEVTTSANEAKIVNPSDWFIADDATHKGGIFYIGYFEKDLNGAMPIKRNYSNSNLCIDNDFMEIYPVRVEHNAEVLNIENVDYLSDTWGLNAGISFYRDYTQLVIDNKHLIFPAIQLGMARKVLDLVKTTARSNPTQRMGSDMIQEMNFELYGNSELGIQGIDGKYTSRINTIKNALFPEPLISIGTLS